MNTCDHYNYVKTKAYAESLKNVFANMCLQFLQLIGRPGFKKMHETFATVKKNLPLKSGAFHNCNC